MRVPAFFSARTRTAFSSKFVTNRFRSQRKRPVRLHLQEQRETLNSFGKPLRMRSAKIHPRTEWTEIRSKRTAPIPNRQTSKDRTRMRSSRLRKKIEPSRFQ